MVLTHGVFTGITLLDRTPIGQQKAVIHTTKYQEKEYLVYVTILQVLHY